MPRITLPHDFPHEPAEGATTRGSQRREGGGSIAPASMTPGERGFPTQASGAEASGLMRHLYDGDSYERVVFPGITKEYFIKGRKTPRGFYASGTQVLYDRNPSTGIATRTDLTAHPDGHGRWVFDNPASVSSSQPREGNAPPDKVFRPWGSEHPPAQSALTSPRPGPSGASSSQVAAEELAPGVLEDIFRRAVTMHRRARITLNDHRPIYTFHGKRLPDNPPNISTNKRDRLASNRNYVAEQIASLLSREYRVEGNQCAPNASYLNTSYLEATSHRGGAGIPIYVRLASRGEKRPPFSPPLDRPYLIAIVEISDDGTLKSLYLIPIKHETPNAAQHVPVAGAI